MEAKTTTLGFPEEPKLEPTSPRNSDDEDDETEPDETDGEEEEEGGSGAGAGTGRAVVSGGPPLKKGPWTPEEDRRLRTYVEAHGEGSWNTVQGNAGLNRCGKSCRLRWANHLRPHLKKGPFSREEERMIIELHAMHGNKWAKMACALPGRTDNEIKNFWNTRSKRLSKAGLDLYPDGLLSRVANQDTHCHSPEDSRGKKRPNELSQGSGLEFDDIIFEKLDYKKRAENFLAPTFIIPDSIPVDGINLPVDGINHPLKSHASSGIVSGYSGSPTYEQFPHEAEKTCYTDINPGIARNHSFPFNNAIRNGPPILDGNFSTSGTIQRPMKMELPLIQDTGFEPINSCWSSHVLPETPLELADNCIVSPASVLTKPECFPSQDNGLLDAMVHQGHVPTKFQGAYEGLVPPCLYGYPSLPSSAFGDNRSSHILPPTPLELADNCIVSPASVLTKPECFPSQDNGLLHAMVHQGHVPTKFQGAYEGLVPPYLYGYPSPPSSAFGDNLLEGSPLDEFRTSQSRASLDALVREGKDDMFVGKYLLPDPCMLDASSEAGFLNEDSPHSEFQPMNGELNAQLFGGSFDEVMLSAAGDCHQLGFESATWKSMPGSRHMSEPRNRNQQQL